MARYVATRLARTALLAALLVISFLLTRAVIVPTMQLAPTEATPRAVETPRAVTLAERHDCWSGEAPADMQGVLPGHVVVTVDGSTRYAGERMVGRALEQIFEGADHGLTVHAFCR